MFIEGFILFVLYFGHTHHYLEAIQVASREPGGINDVTQVPSCKACSQYFEPSSSPGLRFYTKLKLFYGARDIAQSVKSMLCMQ